MTDDSQSFREGPFGDVYDLEVSLDPETNQKVIYWSDIAFYFPKARFVKKGNTFIAFVRNIHREGCEPRRIRHYPGITLEVVMDNGSDVQANSVPVVTPAVIAGSVVDQTVSPAEFFLLEGESPLPYLNSVAIHTTEAAMPTFAATAVSSSINETALATSALPSHRLLQRSQSMLQESSTQLVLYEKAVQAGHLIQADAIMHGMHAMRRDMQEEFRILHSEVAKNDELKALTRKIQDLEAAAEAQTMRIEEMHKQTIELQERSLRMQQEALDRLALIQNKVAAILTQNYELHEYPIPRLFIVLPKADSSRTETLTRGVRSLFAKQFKLYFLCECGDHTKPADGQPQNPNLKHEIHLARHEGYDIDRPTEFFDKYGSYILALLQMLKYGVTIAGVVVPPLGQLKIVDSLDDFAEGIDHVLKDIGPKVDSSIAYIEGLTGVQSQLSSSDPNAASITSATLGGLEALEGADLRQLESFLKSNDEGRVLGNLYRIVTSEGHVKWVCLDHYRENYRAKAAQDLRDAVEEIGGKYEEITGRVEIRLPTPIVARRFYTALNSSRSVQELHLLFAWSPTMQEIRELRDAVKTTNIRHVLLHGSDRDVPLSDVFNNGRRSDPILQMMSGGKVQSLDLNGWEGFWDRISTIPTILHVRKLTIHTRGRWSRRAPRLVEILRASPLLTELTCWGDNIDLVLDPIVVALESSKLAQALKLEVIVEEVYPSIQDRPRAFIQFEAGTSRIVSVDLRVKNTDETKLFQHPLVRVIHILSKHDPLPLEGLRRCLKANTGLESVVIICSDDPFHPCLTALKELFVKYAHQSPRLSLTNGKSTFTTDNIQDVNTGHLDLAIDNNDIEAGCFTAITGNYTVNVQRLRLNPDTTAANMNTLLRILEIKPTDLRFKDLSISLNASSSPSVLASLYNAAEKCSILQDTSIHVELADVGGGSLFSSSQMQQWRVLQDHATRIDISRRLPPFPQSTHIGPCRRLESLQLVMLHHLTEQQFSWILAAVRRVGSSSSPTATNDIVEPIRLRELRLKDCHLSFERWLQLVHTLDVLTLRFLYIDDYEGFSYTLLAALVDHCISTTAAADVGLSAKSSEALKDTFDIQDLRAREHQHFRIVLHPSTVEESFVVTQNERLKKRNVGWVSIETGAYAIAIK